MPHLKTARNKCKHLLVCICAEAGCGARAQHASPHARHLGASRAAELRATIAPVFLRREKKAVLPPADGCGSDIA